LPRGSRLAAAILVFLALLVGTPAAGDSGGDSVRIVMIDIAPGEEVYLEGLRVGALQLIVSASTEGAVDRGEPPVLVVREARAGSLIVQYVENTLVPLPPLRLVLEDVSATSLLVSGRTIVEAYGVHADEAYLLGYLSLDITGSTIGSLEAATPTMGDPHSGYAVTIRDSTLLCQDGAEARLLLGSQKGEGAAKLILEGLTLGCEGGSGALKAYVYGPVVFSNVSQQAETVEVDLDYVSGYAVVEDSNIAGILRVARAPNSQANVTVLNLTLKPGTAEKPALYLEATETIIAGSRITTGVVEGSLARVIVEGTIVRAGTAILGVEESILVNNSIVRVDTATIVLSRPGTPATLVINGSTLQTELPLKIVANTNVNISLRDTIVDGPGLAVRLEDTRALVEAERIVMRPPESYITLYALPPATGYGEIHVSDSYLGGPTGPEVAYNGTLQRPGATLLALSGVPGRVVVESWKPSPAGPLLRDSTVTPPPITIDVPVTALLGVEVLVGEEWERAALLVLSEPAREVTVRAPAGVEVYGVVAPAGMGTILWASQGVGGVETRVALPAYTTIIVVLYDGEPVEQAPGPSGAETATTSPPQTTTITSPPGEPARRPSPLLAGVLLLALVLAAGFWYSMRGRR